MSVLATNPFGNDPAFGVNAPQISGMAFLLAVFGILSLGFFAYRAMQRALPQELIGSSSKRVFTLDDFAINMINLFCATVSISILAFALTIDGYLNVTQVVMITAGYAIVHSLLVTIAWVTTANPQKI